MELPYKNYITSDDLFKLKGYQLSTCLLEDNSGNIQETINHFLNEIASSIYYYVLTQCCNREAAKLICTDEAYEDLIAHCQLEQAVYVLENGNLLAVVSDDLINVNELRKVKAFAPLVIEEIRGAKLFYCGMS